MPYSRHIAAKTTPISLTTYEVFLTGEHLCSSLRVVVGRRDNFLVEIGGFWRVVRFTKISAWGKMLIFVGERPLGFDF